MPDDPRLTIPVLLGTIRAGRRSAHLGRLLLGQLEGRDEVGTAEEELGADALATDLRLRDESDAARMQPAPDAIEIDTTSLEVEDVVDRIESLVRERSAA